MCVPTHSVRIHRTAFSPVDPTSHSASHSGPGPLADTMVRIPHGSWRDDAARVVRSSLMSTEVSLVASLYATWIVLTSQPTIPAACRRPSRLCVQPPPTPPFPQQPRQKQKQWWLRRQLQLRRQQQQELRQRRQRRRQRQRRRRQQPTNIMRGTEGGGGGGGGVGGGGAEGEGGGGLGT
jgi:hypothetical protein